ncbi:sensor histidine kinase [Winogradskyella sp.]|uniref:sensor histidine kinase n=1 Tax=Winogradskyella sp. TaxID=1883156 RepID=UPI003BAD629C
MKFRYIVLIVISLVLLGGLAYWQISHLAATQKLEKELELKGIQSMLMTTAISIRKVERTDSLIRTDASKQFRLIDSLVNKNFKDYDYNFDWAIVDGNETIDERLISHNKATTDILESDIKVCLSCLVMIDIVDDKVEGHDAGFILNQSPAQMMEMRGMDKSNIKYIYLAYTDDSSIALETYTIPLVFLIGLGFLFFWLVRLIRQQGLLIKQKNEFVNHLSHQFQTPLSSIKIGANLLSKKYVDEDLIKIIQTEGNRLENHIKTVLHWVKSDANRLQIHKEEIRVTDLIENALKEMKPVFQINKTTVQFVPPENEYIVKADKNHLQLMLFNIWENAIKHNEVPVSITITVERMHHILTIKTADDGKGVSKIDDSIKYKGLGLEYINTIMEDHKGALKISKNEPKGLTVSLNFPINE